MITLYGMGSPNVVKIVIALEEIGQPYALRHVDVMRGEGQHAEFLALNPLGKVPVMVDGNAAGDVGPIFESGAILIYLAETYAPALLPSSGGERWEVLKWLIAQVAYAGPMLGQMNHFQLVASEANSYGGRRYRDMARAVYRDFDARLAQAPWLGGSSFSIADIAMYPWAGYLSRHGFSPDDHPHLLAWRDRIDARPSVKRAAAAIAAMMAAAAPGRPPDGDFDSFFARVEPGPAADLDRYLALGPFTSV